ncbi:hypothetical protein LIER_00701 [Lithospermum erythrorhizon]|uniref:Reverse transcriptase RNase H-like domain-containing protein n=1 Tax=Lithospermum erythrorhizon TaxID=34254 RepID=A0AAV3NJJ9_LITER
MQAPKSYKEVQRLARFLVALNGFISRSTDRNFPFFKKLRQTSKEDFIWDEECAKAFEELKAYLSHVLHGPEKAYPLIDKFWLALVMSAQKLKAYIEKHPIVVVTEQPMNKILSSPAQAGRLTKWAVELSEFHITFAPRTGIKAQALADFVIECTTMDPPPPPLEEAEYVPILPERPEWTLYFNGASNPKGAGAEILIQGPDGMSFEYALRFTFKDKSLSITRLVVRGDSKLVIEQIRGDCGIKSENLRKYHAKANALVMRFNYVIFEHTP